MALHLCASAGQKTGFGALRKCKSDDDDDDGDGDDGDDDGDDDG